MLRSWRGHYGVPWGPTSWRLRPDSPGAVAFVATWRGGYFLCHMVPSVPKAQKRNLLSDPVFHQEDLFAPATLDAARHAARDVSLYRGSHLGLPRRLRRLSGGPSLRLRHPGDALNLRLLLLRRSALKPSSWARFPPQKKSPDPPRGFFGGRSLSFLCGPVRFRGMAPHHRPIHPEHFHRRFHMDRFPVWGV